MKERAFTFGKVFFLIVLLMFFFGFNQSCKENKDGNREEIKSRLDIPPDENQVDYSPADGITVNVNPPPFTWLQVKKEITYPPDYVAYNDSAEKVWVPIIDYFPYTLQISRDNNFRSGTIKRKGIDISTYALDKSLEPGEWFWRYGVENGKTVYSKSRRFILGRQPAHGQCSYVG